MDTATENVCCGVSRVAYQLNGVEENGRGRSPGTRLKAFLWTGAGGSISQMPYDPGKLQELTVMFLVCTTVTSVQHA
jgi:hypothetical protein